MARSASVISSDAKLLGQMLNDGRVQDLNNSCQVLSAYVEELAEGLDRAERQIQELELRLSRL